MADARHTVMFRLPALGRPPASLGRQLTVYPYAATPFRGYLPGVRMPTASAMSNVVTTDDDLIALAATDHDPHLNTILCEVCLARWELNRRRAAAAMAIPG